MAAKAAAKKKQVLVVTELDLVSIETQRLQLADIRAKEREAGAALKQVEATVIALLQQGASVQGSRTVTVNQELGACRPKYQELWVQHLAAEHGITAAQAIEDAQKAYPPKPHDVLVIGAKPKTV